MGGCTCYMCVCIHIYTSTYTGARARTHTHTDIHIHTYMHTYVCNTHTHTHPNTHTHTRTLTDSLTLSLSLSHTVNHLEMVADNGLVQGCVTMPALTRIEELFDTLGTHYEHIRNTLGTNKLPCLPSRAKNELYAPRDGKSCKENIYFR